MRELDLDPPYLTFSEDWAYAFVERTPRTGDRARALRWLDGQLRDDERPALPPIRRWNPWQARVVREEIWDEQDGVRLARELPGTRTFWRIEVRGALALEPACDADGQRLGARLVALRHEGRLRERELMHAKLLLRAVEEAEVDRLTRQALRPLHAPRAPLEDGAGALLGRLMMILLAALGEHPEEHGQAVARALWGIQQRLEAEEERQVHELRAELEGLEMG